MKILLEIYQLPKTPNQLLRKHFRVVNEEKNRWGSLVAIELAKVGHLNTRLSKAKAVTLTRYSTMEPDFDGLVGSFKYVLDAIVRLGMLPDDKPSYLGELKYKWEKCKRNEQGISLEIEW